MLQNQIFIIYSFSESKWVVGTHGHLASRPVQKQHFYHLRTGWEPNTCDNVVETFRNEGGNSQLFKTSKFIKIGSLLKKL